MLPASPAPSPKTRQGEASLVSRTSVKPVSLLGSLLLAAMVFAVDLVESADVALAVLYAVAVLAALRSPGSRPVIAIAALSTVLSVVGAVVPLDAVDWVLVAKNRAIGMLAIWGTALAGLRLREAALTARRDEQALRESEQRFRSIFDTVRDPVFVSEVGADGRPRKFLETNEAAARVYGYTHREFRALDLSEVVVGAGIIEQYPALFDRIRREGSILLESEHRTKGGVRVPVEVRAQAITLGGREAVLSVARDITARKQEEQALRASERRERARADELEALMAAVPALVFIAHDSAATRITGNRVAREMLRMPPGANLSQSASDEDASARSFASYEGERRWAPEELPVQRAARGEELWGYEERLRFDDGVERHLYGNAVPLRDDQGRPRGALAAAVDVTEQKRIQERLARSAEELEQRVYARTADLAASKQQLAERTGQLQRLTAQLSQAEQRERLKLSRILHDDVQQLLVAGKIQLSLLENAATATQGGKISELLDAAIESTRALSHELSPQVLYDRGLGDALRWLARHKCSEYGLELEFTVDEAAEPADEDVRVTLFQAVRELLLNVVKHARVDRAWIAMQRPSRDQICISVVDDGPGFDPAAAARASARGAEHLGLFAIQERLEVIGGSMQIHSAPGQGTRVQLWAPRTAAAPETAMPARTGDDGRQQASAGPSG